MILRSRTRFLFELSRDGFGEGQRKRSKRLGENASFSSMIPTFVAVVHNHAAFEMTVFLYELLLSVITVNLPAVLIQHFTCAA